jgi:hypothetical protein
MPACDLQCSAQERPPGNFAEGTSSLHYRIRSTFYNLKGDADLLFNSAGTPVCINSVVVHDSHDPGERPVDSIAARRHTHPPSWMRMMFALPFCTVGSAGSGGAVG